MEEPKKNVAEEYLDACDYISQDGHTVYIDTEALVVTMEAYGDYMVGMYIRENEDDKEDDKEDGSQIKE